MTKPKKNPKHNGLKCPHCSVDPADIHHILGCLHNPDNIKKLDISL